MASSVTTEIRVTLRVPWLYCAVFVLFVAQALNGAAKRLHNAAKWLSKLVDFCVDRSIKCVVPR
jgi:hypothetical protein